MKQSGYEFSVSTKTMPGQEPKRVRERERVSESEAAIKETTSDALSLVQFGASFGPQTNKTNKQTNKKQQKQQPEETTTKIRTKKTKTT